MLSYFACRERWQAALDLILQELIAQHKKEVSEKQSSLKKKELDVLFPFHAIRYDAILRRHLQPIYDACEGQDYLKSAFEQVAPERRLTG